MSATGVPLPARVSQSVYGGKSMRRVSGTVRLQPAGAEAQRLRGSEGSVQR
jgi:hypothetical protein